MIDTVAPPAGAPPRRRRRRRIAAVAASAILAAAGVTAWLVVGMTPHLSDGGTSAIDPEAVVRADVLMFGPDEQAVTDPSDGTVDGFWSFRNDGAVTIVVSAAPQPQAEVAYDIQLLLIPPRGGSPVGDADAVTVGPGAQFGVKYAWGPGCAAFGPGTGEGTDSVRLRVDTLGITRTVDVPTNRPFSWHTQTGYTPPATCES